MKTYRTLTSILTLGVMVSCGSDNSRDSATNDTAALTLVTLSTDPGNEPTTGDVTAGNITMGTPTSGISASDGATGGVSTSDGFTSTSDGTTTSDPRPGNPMCKIQSNGDGIGICDKQPSPEAFEPVIEWEWTAPGDSWGSLVTPLVANLTDDNGDGEIDLCDIPDIIVLDYQQDDLHAFGHIYVLDGATGSLHFKIEAELHPQVTPALGDIDGDGLVEIISSTPLTLESEPRLIAFEHDGTLKWQSASSSYYSIGLADLDNDGDIEIFTRDKLWDHKGLLYWDSPIVNSSNRATTAADLDSDGDLELILENAAYHHDGSVYYENPELWYGFPQVANLDDDLEPEILLTNNEGIIALEHTGEIKYQKPSFGVFASPAAIADFDGDGLSDFGISSGDYFTTYRADGTIIWQAPISDNSGLSGGTAFDFNGDGIFEVVYGDEKNIFVFGDQGQVLMQIPHSSGTIIEYPVVADVDNDGSAEIVVVSSYGQGQTGPTVRVIGDKANRWPQARRIWNQHSYHVNNVNEDGTIPQYQQPSWKTHNTFRVNSTLGSNSCEPPTPG